MGLMDDKVAIISGAGPDLGRSAAAAILREGGSVPAIVEADDE